MHMIRDGDQVRGFLSSNPDGFLISKLPMGIRFFLHFFGLIRRDILSG